jgi:anti-sigma factor RsiW
MDCEKFAQVHAYHDGELGAGARAEVESHLAACAACAALLADLRGLTRMIADAPLAAMPDRLASRFHGAWYQAAAADRGALRTVSWLTGAAAALLVGAILMWPHARPTAPAARSNAWEIAAVTPPTSGEPHAGSEEDAKLVRVAQWIANDLSSEGGR